MDKLIAQTVNINGQSIEGALVGISTIGDIVTRILGILIPIAGIILLFVLIWGGYDYMMSQGNPEKIKSAQAKMTTGIIGFVLLIISFFLVRLIAKIFGLDTGGML